MSTPKFLLTTVNPYHNFFATEPQIESLLMDPSKMFSQLSAIYKLTKQFLNIVLY